MAERQTPTTLVDWLDDLTVRFLLNLPASELSAVPRLCFQVEEAQWFYEDFVRPAVIAAGAPPLPNLPLRQFCLLLFQHCPLLSGFTDAQHLAAYEEFLAYKVRVPVRGAILLDQSMEKVLLVRGWKKGASWSFPRGKINKDEKDLDCAIREAWEETGYDIRQGGLVPEKDEDSTYIDITMREQHMRLFVFRGVPEDTHFEPKTRKEIGKIQWYSIRDLPGFKKQKPQGGETAHANKFYMVAPFLGPLKKWISRQRREDEVRRRSDALNNGAAAAQIVTEDEEEGEEEQTPERDLPLVDGKSEELRRLLSIGGSAPAPASSVPEPAKSTTHTGDLLAMLRNSAKPTNGNEVPHTPFEQINPFPLQPETPQPDHLRHPSLSYQQQQPPPPQFPFSPQGVPQQEMQQRNFSLPTPNVFGSGSAGFPPHQQGPPGFPGMVNPHMQHQQFPQRQSIPSGPLPGMPFSHQNGFGGQFNGQQMPPMQRPQQMQPPPPQAQCPPLQQPPPNPTYIVQGAQGAIANGPVVPKASQLPPPRLNAQSLKLLNAFKAGHNVSSGAAKPVNGSASTSQLQQQQRPTSTHQTALLDLLRRPSTSQSPIAQIAEATQPADEPASPTPTDTTIKASKPPRRSSTLNEITRTLPARTKAKSPRGAESSELQPTLTRTGGGQLWDPNDPAKFPSLKTDAPSSNIQLPPAGNTLSKSPRSKHATTRGSPSRREGAAKLPQQDTNHTPPPQYTILARPGSAKGPKSPAAPDPVAPPPRSQHHQQGQKHDPSGWKAIAESLPNEFASEVEAAGRKHTEASPSIPREDRVKETFKKTSATQPKLGAPRRFDQTEYTIHDARGSRSVQSHQSPARSPLHHGFDEPIAAFQPKQVLKRSQGDASGPMTSSSQAPQMQMQQKPADTKDQLLALFGKASAGGTPMPPPAPLPQSEAQAPFPHPAPPQRDQNQSTVAADEQKSALLGLFNTPPTSTQPTPTPSLPMAPPPAPGIEPEHRPTLASKHILTGPGPGPAPAIKPQPSFLDVFNKSHDLDLFKNKQDSGSTVSPGTPISPFTLGTPATGGGQRSRLGSVDSSAGVKSPVEGKNREFLMGYLKGVVRDEGFGGAKDSRG